MNLVFFLLTVLLQIVPTSSFVAVTHGGLVPSKTALAAKKGRKEKPFEEMFALLVMYQEREGSCNVPRKHKEEGFRLGYWLNDQSVLKKENTLEANSQKRLE